jgi:hypothetical protein
MTLHVYLSISADAGLYSVKYSPCIGLFIFRRFALYLAVTLRTSFLTCLKLACGTKKVHSGKLLLKRKCVLSSFQHVLTILSSSSVRACLFGRLLTYVAAAHDFGMHQSVACVTSDPHRLFNNRYSHDHPCRVLFFTRRRYISCLASQFLRLIIRQDSVKPGLLIISRGTAILLLFIYLAYLWFQA